MSVKGKVKPQLAKMLFKQNISTMKQILILGEFKFGDRNSDGYKYYRKKIMNAIYSQLNYTLSIYEKIGLVDKCGCGSSLDKREGYTSCQTCAGCGFKNSDYLNDALANYEGWNPNIQEVLKELTNSINS